ncbi:hypothetical protein BBJ28_00024049 [Nothophytophthora sp. Chile5]|nr:hypothetical protein BBJ28_00024049 [Nothophytophthora sp. Chile5]
MNWNHRRNQIRHLSRTPRNATADDIQAATMGGQTSRMVREIVEDSMYIVRQTNRATYERGRATREEVQANLQELRRLKKETFESAKQDAQRSEVFRSFQTNVTSQKQQLDEAVRACSTESFVQQFELPKSYQKIAGAHLEERRKVQDAAQAAAASEIPPQEGNKDSANKP